MPGYLLDVDYPFRKFIIYFFFKHPFVNKSGKPESRQAGKLGSGEARKRGRKYIEA